MTIVSAEQVEGDNAYARETVIVGAVAVVGRDADRRLLYVASLKARRPGVSA